MHTLPNNLHPAAACAALDRGASWLWAGLWPGVATGMAIYPAGRGSRAVSLRKQRCTAL